MEHKDLINRLRKLSAENKAPRDCIDEAADVIEAQEKELDSAASELMLVIERLEKDRDGMAEEATRAKIELEGARMNYRNAMSINDSHLKVLHEAAMELHDLREELVNQTNIANDFARKIRLIECPREDPIVQAYISLPPIEGGV